MQDSCKGHSAGIRTEWIINPASDARRSTHEPYGYSINNIEVSGKPQFSVQLDIWEAIFTALG